MLMQIEKKRVFLAARVVAPWQEEMPKGKVLDKEVRHITLAFLGSIDVALIEKLLKSFPKPPFQLGVCGVFDRCLFLPEKHPHVVAWNADFGKELKQLKNYQSKLSSFLKEHQFSIDHREWFPHVTLSREPFDQQDWEKAFIPLPFYIDSIHLYESLGSSRYQSLVSYPLIIPFEEIEHCADIAFRILGEDLECLYKNALTALSFKCPELITKRACTPLSSLEEIVMRLNKHISVVDREVGCPFKAVSFHGEAKALTNELLEWEMIVDV